MTHDFIIGGVLISTIAPALLIALLLTGLVSSVLVRIGFYHLVWQRPIVEVSIFCMLLAVIVLMVPDGRSIWP